MSKTFEFNLFIETEEDITRDEIVARVMNALNPEKNTIIMSPIPNPPTGSPVWEFNVNSK